ncbi:uncharacterized protein LOC108221034 isoform X2 [Daucus carota subsp. sativus]|uniref:uncharacterized protein LOC108221034 isoform X2 n=1 Tax=Daucus carota subsp. sativus TaxID=79200 RepID=UPI003082CE23
MAVNSIPQAASNQNKSQSETKQRTTDPGVRVIGGKIYDSEKGKTCHQCRQKTRSFTAACKNKKKDKTCTMLFCHKCLLNRYGEKAEEVEVLEEWICPKCRGICNCSCCRKKQGHQPTGILTHRAKATGYSSVSELLQANGPENFGLVKNVKDTGATPKRPSSSGKVTSPGKKGKENLLDGRVDMNLEHPTPSKLKEIEKMQGVTLENNEKQKKTKQGKLRTVSAGQKDAAALKLCSSGALPESTPDKSQDSDTVSAGPKDAAAQKLCSFGTLPESNSNKSQDSDISIHMHAEPNEKVNDPKLGDGCMKKVSAEVPADTFGNKKRNANKDIEVIDQEKTKKRVKHDTGMPFVKDNNSGLQFQSQEVGNDIPLPHGTELITIGDLELPPEDVGNALQFLEFCAAFGKNLNMKKGQSSVILKELMNGQSRILRRTEQHSPVVHFHIQLLSLLRKDYTLRSHKLSPSHGKSSWLFALKSCLSESPNAKDLLPIIGLDSESGGYNTLNFSMKLRILIFLCDEVLETERIRDWINNQESKFAQKAKQAKKKVLAAKDKVKSLKQKLADELAKEITAKDGSSLSISEHDEIVSQIKCEAAQAHKEMLESMNMVPKAKKRSQALRTQPLFLDGDGRAFWRLNCYPEESNILVQDIGNGDDSIVFGEKWITFDNEQEKVVEKHISLRERMVRAQSAAIIPYALSISFHKGGYNQS